MVNQKRFSVAILGGGITGTSIFYTLCKYTDIKSVALFEKCSELGQINSKKNNNSQTLHFGDIEANYSFEKACSANNASKMVVEYLEGLSEDEKHIFRKSHQMLLAVGDEEIDVFEKRFEKFKELYPHCKKLSFDEISKIEPAITAGRKKEEKIIAGYSENGYVVDFGGLSKSFAKKAKEFNPETEIFLENQIERISKKENGYEIISNKKIFYADVIVVAMCSHSLMFAKSLGYGKEYSLLPVGGNFYTSSKKLLNGKVYTMQSGKLPFAGVHGDPNLHNENETRFGPTANILPILERRKISTISDFIKSSFADLNSIFSFLKVISEPTLFFFLLKSIVYEIPYFGQRAYAKLCQKIIPSLSHNDFKNGKTKAGIRPQLIDNATGKLKMGEVEIVGDNIIFNISPSPGASVCLKNAEKNVERIVKFFHGKYLFNRNSFNTDLLK